MRWKVSAICAINAAGTSSGVAHCGSRPISVKPARRQHWDCVIPAPEKTPCPREHAMPKSIAPWMCVSIKLSIPWVMSFCFLRNRFARSPHLLITDDCQLGDEMTSLCSSNCMDGSTLPFSLHKAQFFSELLQGFYLSEPWLFVAIPGCLCAVDPFRKLKGCP